MIGLSTSQIEKFREDGFLGPFTALQPHEMVPIRDHISKNVLSYTPKYYPSQKHCRHLDDQIIFDLCSHPSIIKKMNSIFGEDLILWRSHIFLKEKGAGEVPWHQDRDYWPLEPIINISAWLAIDEANKHNSCVQVIPGSHKRIIPHIKVRSPKITASEFEKMADPNELSKEKTAINMELKSGEFFIFNNLTLHRSAPNTSERSRMGLAVRVTVPIVKIYHEEIFKTHQGILLSGSDRYGFNKITKKENFKSQSL